MKKLPETAWLKEADSQILQQSVKDLSRAIKSSFLPMKNGKKAGFPHFKKRGVKDSFRYPQRVEVDNGKVYLPKIGWIEYYDSRAIEGTIVQATVKRVIDEWFISLTCEIEREVVPVMPKNYVGIDVGIKSLAVLSSGTVIENPHFLKKHSPKLAREQRKLSRKKKGSKNFIKQQKKVAQCHLNIKNARFDFLHKTSIEIVKNHDAFVVEDLNIRGLLKNHAVAKVIADASWHTLISFIEYKAHQTGKLFQKIGRFIPTSKTCSGCGAKQAMPLKVRIFKCSNCDLVLDRDLNASINIRAAGHAVFASGAISTS